MAVKFHINSKGEPGKCSAQHGGCPFGGESDHYETKEGASAAFERSMTEGVLPTLSKAPTREQVVQTLDNMDRGSNEIPEGVEFVEPEPEVEASAKPKTPVEVLQSAIQDELAWADKALDEARKREAKDSSVVTDSGLESQRPKTDFELRQEREREEYQREQTAKRVRALYGEDHVVHPEVREIEEYQRELREDLSKVGNSWPVVTELRETLRERLLKKELNDLQYKSSEGNPSLKELEEKVNWPIRERDESDTDFKERVKKAGAELTDSDSVLLLRKHADESRIKAELDEAEKKRKDTGLPEGVVKRNSKVDSAVHKNVVLFGQDEENLKAYNSFANRASRLLKGKKEVLSDRRRLDALPAGRKLIDYDPTGTKATVWTKTGHNSWVNENGTVSTDDERKLPATIVE